MRRYEVIDERKLRKSTRIAGFAAGIFLILLGVWIHSIYTSLVGAIIFAAVLLRKDMAFTEEGFETVYDFIVFKNTNIWRYEEISNIHRDPAPNPDYMGLVIQRDMTVRRATVKASCAENVIEMALEKNPKIYVGDVDK